MFWNIVYVTECDYGWHGGHIRVTASGILDVWVGWNAFFKPRPLIFYLNLGIRMRPKHLSRKRWLLKVSICSYWQRQRGRCASYWTTLWGGVLWPAANLFPGNTSFKQHYLGFRIFVECCRWLWVRTDKNQSLPRNLLSASAVITDRNASFRQHLCIRPSQSERFHHKDLASRQLAYT